MSSCLCENTPCYPTIPLSTGYALRLLSIFSVSCVDWIWSISISIISARKASGNDNIFCLSIIISAFPENLIRTGIVEYSRRGSWDWVDSVYFYN